MLIPIKQSSFTVLYDGYGKVEYNSRLTYWPMISTRPDETHASLILINKTIDKVFHSFDLKFTAKVEKQLRMNSLPNTWETMWVLFNFNHSDGHESGDYFVHKTNGTEMGSFVDMEQTYYETNNKKPCQIDKFYNYTVSKRGPLYTFKINNDIVIERQHIETIGSIGLYCEDAKIVAKTIDFRSNYL